MNLFWEIVKKNRWIISEIERNKKISRTTIKKAADWWEIMSNWKIEIYSFLLEKNYIDLNVKLPELFEIKEKND